MNDEFKLLRYGEVPFHGDKIYGAFGYWQSHETIFVPIRPICDILGLHKDQINKIKADEVLAEGAQEIVIPSSGGNQSTFCLRYDLLPMWLTTIHATKVKIEYRAKILLYRKEVAKVLAKYFLGTNYSLEQPSSKTASFINEVVNTTVKIAMQEISAGMIQQVVKATLVEIRASDPVHLVNQRLDIAERLHTLSSLTDQDRFYIKNFVMGMIFPGTSSMSLSQQNLTHASDFLYQKSLEGYSWDYKTLEAAAAQLTRIAKHLWEEDGYIASKDSIILKSGRSVEAYIFPRQYAEKALALLVEQQKIRKP